jgi:signal transduction histidine kinase
MSTKPKILLVDDREENLLALEGLLKRHEAELLKARSGKEALELLLEHEVALALVDVRMPEMDGFQLAELMRGSERTREIPLIFITAGLHDQARVFKGYDSGAVDFLVKPLDPRILNSKVTVFLQLNCQKRQLAERVLELEAALVARKRAEEDLREADRRKDEFLAVLSHELRNPLAPIKNSLFILDRVPPEGEQAGRARGVIERQMDQLTRLIDDLLDMTRITRNKIVLQREPLELNRLVRQAIDDHRSLLHRHELDLEERLASKPMWVHGDGARLAQVVSNLLQNAAKFTGRGGSIQVSIDEEIVVRGNPSPRWANIRVRDTGVGMDPDTLASLFQPFMQADSSLDRSKGGLGLGLALVKGVVQLHGGEVSARSDGLGKGSEFFIRLPLEEAPASQPSNENQRPPVSRRRVLVIEDNIDAAESLREALELDEHEVTVAHNGQEGLAKAREVHPEVVLCDIGLPEMDGYAVARAFRADPALRNTFLVALTGYGLPEDLRKAAEAGFQQHLVKPPSLEKLEELLGSRQGDVQAPASEHDRG